MQLASCSIKNTFSSFLHVRTECGEGLGHSNGAERCPLIGPSSTAFCQGPTHPPLQLPRGPRVCLNLALLETNIQYLWGNQRSSSHLCPFIEEGIPNSQEDVANKTVHKNDQEPVEGHKSQVDSMLFQVCHQLGKLFGQEIFEDSLIHLDSTEQ